MSYIIGPPIEAKVTFEVSFWSEEHERWIFDSAYDSLETAFRSADDIDLKTQVQKRTESVALVVREGE